MVSTKGSVGYDIFSVNVINLTEGKIQSGIRTNLKIRSLPSGYYLRLENKSSSMYFVMGGVFDVDYTGEILIRIFPVATCTIGKFKPICQAIITKYECPLSNWINVDRGNKGHGSCSQAVPIVMYEKDEEENVVQVISNEMETNNFFVNV